MGKIPPEKESKSLIEVEVAPCNEVVISGKWGRFKNFIKKLIATPEARAAEKSVRDYLNEAYESEIENKKRSKYVNKKTAAEIDSILAESRARTDQRQRSNLLFEQEYESVKAGARLKNAEALSLEAQTAIKIFETMKAHGFEAGMKVVDGNIQIMALEEQQDQILIDDAIERKKEIVVEDEQPNTELETEPMPEPDDVATSVSKEDMECLDIPAFLRKQPD